MNLEEIIRKIDHKKWLSTEENEYLFRLLESMQAESQQKIIKEIIILGNEGIIYEETLKYKNDSEYEDLLQEARMTLIQAIDNYDRLKGISFHHYAKKAIYYSLMQYYSEKRRLITIPHSFFNTHPSKEEWDSVWDYTTTCSLNYAVENKQGEKHEVVEFIEDQMDIEMLIIRSHIFALVREALNVLTPIEQDIISDRYGINTGIPMTRKEIEEKYQLSPSKIRTIEKKALEKLKNVKELWKLKME